MPVRYIIDKERRLVISIGSDRVTWADVKAHQDRLLSDPDFNPEFNQFMDGTSVTNFDLSADEIRTAASRKIFSPTSRRAFVGTSTFMYGMGRMVQTYYEMSKEASPMTIFHDRAAAWKWLGIESPPDTIRPEGTRALAPDAKHEESA